MTTAARPDDPAAAYRERLAKFTSWIEQICKKDPGARRALRSGLRRGINDVQLQPMHRLVAVWVPNSLSGDRQLPYYAVASMIAAQARHTFAETDDEDDTETTESSEATGAAGTVTAETAEAPSAHAVNKEAGFGSGGEPTGESAGQDGAPSADAAKKPLQRYGPSLGTAFAMAVTTASDRDRAMRDSAAEARLNLLTRQSAQGLHRHLPASVGYLRELKVPVDWAQLLSDLLAWPHRSGEISRRWLQDYYRLREQEARKRVDEDGHHEQEQPLEAS
ncbi:type I-E CRISPR-associated protein Cse2/CasB [Streptomyces sp. NPDC093085]|uniref:type I-E CRISPR-associated protein Cse2/CasB n=1 Tax=Streptomyces sp. NPDC093085 TaxID=3155068 RepID=UPI00342956DD